MMAFKPFNWQCDYCGQKQVVTEQCHDTWSERIRTRESFFGTIDLVQESVVCANPDCSKLTLTVSIWRMGVSGGHITKIGGGPVYKKRLLPVSLGKEQPDFIPEAIREDYLEACLIRDDSPKASATLSRRCLQGMIRDFSGITKSGLFKEIDALRKAVDDGSAPRGVSEESVEAIDHVRGIGNIGAHMEKDINHIVPVDAGEAQALIDLIEILFDDWYVTRENRKIRLGRIEAIAAVKKDQKTPKVDSDHTD